jgi:hypothetical protein
MPQRTGLPILLLLNAGHDAYREQDLDYSGDRMHELAEKQIERRPGQKKPGTSFVRSIRPLSRSTYYSLNNETMTTSNIRTIQTAL